MSATTKDRVITRITASGRCMMQIITPAGHSATCEVQTQAEAFLKIDWLRGHLNSAAPLVRGPIAGKRRDEVTR